MSDLTIHKFETRPRPVEAVLWDGSKKQAKQIIKWLKKTYDIPLDYQDQIRHDANGALQTDTILTSRFTNFLPNEWIVVLNSDVTNGLPEEPYVRSYSADSFADAFRVGHSVA